MRDLSNLKIDGERLWASLMAMAEIGPGVAGGNNRQALTDADGEGRALFRRWCEAQGLEVGVDAMGTMFARREGTDPDALPVMMGSHLDTQPTGGRYDGVLGVLGALEVVRTLDDLGVRTRRPLVIVNWTNEEGTRFQPAMLASGVHAGLHDLAWAHARTDANGISVLEELDRLGWKGAEVPGTRKAHAYFELHIEQGPILEAEGYEIGVVTGVQGHSWLEVTLGGRESHTGSTPMPRRLDAGLGMARITELTHRIALEEAPHGCGAVGHVELAPNSRNIIAGRAVFTVDFRHPELATLEAMEGRLEDGARRIASELGLTITVEPAGGFRPVAFDEGCVSIVRGAAERLGYGNRDLIAGAGHDACWMQRVTPTAMIMCPCKDGLSHNEAEDITPDWAGAGTDVLLYAVLERAEIAS